MVSGSCVLVGSPPGVANGKPNYLFSLVPCLLWGNTCLVPVPIYREGFEYCRTCEIILAHCEGGLRRVDMQAADRERGIYVALHPGQGSGYIRLNGRECVIPSMR